MINRHALFEAIGANLLSAISRADHRAPLTRALRVSFARAQLMHASTQQSPRFLAVLPLASRFLHAHFDARWRVNEMHRSRDLVHILSAWTLRSRDVLLHFCGINRGFNFLWFTQHRNSRS